jgi:hypothetical protein
VREVVADCRKTREPPIHSRRPTLFTSRRSSFIKRLVKIAQLLIDVHQSDEQLIKARASIRIGVSPILHFQRSGAALRARSSRGRRAELEVGTIRMRDQKPSHNGCVQRQVSVRLTGNCWKVSVTNAPDRLHRRSDVSYRRPRVCYGCQQVLGNLPGERGCRR